jgi:hypothetical protein
MNTPITISDIKPGFTGTVQALMQTKPMRKADKFTIYPITDAGEKWLKFQSVSRCILIDKDTGEGLLSKSQSYPTFAALFSGDVAAKFALTPDQLTELKDAIRATSSPECGNSIMICDNSAAHLI